MKNRSGFTLIELVIFMVIMGIAGAGILLVLDRVLVATPTMQYQNVALESASRCVELFLGERQINGYSSITCPASTVPSFCSVPSNYNITANVSCSTMYGESSSNYKTVTVTVGGLGNASLSLLLADY